MEDPRPLLDSAVLPNMKDCEYCAWSECVAVGAAIVNVEFELVLTVEIGGSPLDALLVDVATGVAKTGVSCVLGELFAAALIVSVSLGAWLMV